MSSGIRLAPGRRSVAEAAAVVATPSRAAVLLLRAAIAGTPGLDGALPRLAAALADPGGRDVAADRVDIEVEVRWQLAADAVLRANVERRLLRAATEGVSGIGVVPAPVALAGSTQLGALDACRACLRDAATVHQRLAAARAERAQQVLDDGPLPAVVRNWLRRRSGDRSGDRAEVPRRPTGPDSQVAYWLDRVHLDSDSDQLAGIAVLATRALAEATPDAARQLAELVRTTGGRLAQRRRRASTAATLLEGLAGTTAPVDPELTRTLDQVVTGRLAAIPDRERAAALAELLRAEKVARSREPTKGTESGQPRGSVSWSPAPG